ncbi:MAG: hypothetical protein HUK20_08900 [Fibrobacter sp.]|nr:hypothetical protein [Fibrobacter sp.]
MKRIIVFTLVAVAAFLVACTGKIKFKDPSVLREKTGIIGVFRQSAFYCDGVNPQYMNLGSSKIMVKSGWSSDQDNLFASEMKPGVATLYSYEYTCGDNQTKLALDTADNGRKPFPIAVKIPEKGYCKIVISFLENDNLFSHNDRLIGEHFEKEQIDFNHKDLPYCEIIDTKGTTVSFRDMDSLYTALYTAAMEDAETPKNESIQPLVTIGPGTDMALMSGDNTQVVLVTWHNDPDKYKDGELVTLKDQVLWAYTDKEFVKWFSENEGKVSGNWTMRLRQLLGKSPDFNGTHFTVFWVSVKDVFRPAYQPDIANGNMDIDFSNTYDDDTSEEAMWFRNWFNETKHKSLSKKDGFLWNRLGYTYDWGNPDSKYGLSEFIVREGATLDVKFTRSNKAFLTWLKKR